MKDRVEQPLAPALGVARVLGDVGDQTCIEDALPIVRRIKAAIETDFSVVPFRSPFMLFSEKNRMKVHKNQ
jgi:hypothetical protein